MGAFDPHPYPILLEEEMNFSLQIEHSLFVADLILDPSKRYPYLLEFFISARWIWRFHYANKTESKLTAPSAGCC